MSDGTEPEPKPDPKRAIPQTEDEVVDMEAVRAMIKTGNGGDSRLVDILRRERERKEKLAAKREARRGKKRAAPDGGGD